MCLIQMLFVFLTRWVQKYLESLRSVRKLELAGSLFIYMEFSHNSLVRTLVTSDRNPVKLALSQKRRFIGSCIGKSAGRLLQARLDQELR